MNAFLGLTVAYWALLLTALLPIVCAGIAKKGMFGRPAKDGGYDNNMPREWLARQKDWRARANAAQSNSFEALPLFVGAVIIAHQHQASQVHLDVLALGFLVLRVVYILLYLADQAMARTVVWTLALFVNIAMLFV